MPSAARTVRSPREAFARDVYALVAFYLANPEIPLPQSVSVHHAAESVEHVDVLAENLGCKVYGANPQTDYPLPNTSIPVSLLFVAPR